MAGCAKIEHILGKRRPRDGEDRDASRRGSSGIDPGGRRRSHGGPGRSRAGRAVRRAPRGRGPHRGRGPPRRKTRRRGHAYPRILRRKRGPVASRDLRTEPDRPREPGRHHAGQGNRVQPAAHRLHPFRQRSSHLRDAAVGSRALEISPARRRRPTGRPFLVAIEGPNGAGKTRLCSLLGPALAQARSAACPPPGKIPR